MPAPDMLSLLSRRLKILARAAALRVFPLGLAVSVWGHEPLPPNHGVLLPMPEGPPPRLLGDWVGLRPALESRGFDVGMAYINDVLANVSGGQKRGAVYDGLLKMWLDVDPEKLGLWRGGKFRASFLYPHGHSLSEYHVGDLFTLSNIDALSYFRVHELWYEHEFADGKLSLRAGQLAADEEFTLTDYGGHFINSTFGWLGQLAANVPASAYPFAVPGVRVAWSPTERFRWQAAVFAGDPAMYTTPDNLRNRHGFPWSTDNGALIINEWIWKSDTYQAKAWAIRVGAFLHTGDFEHLRLDQDGLSLADPASSGQAMLKRANHGFYLAGERLLWHEPERSDQGLGGFVRLGYNPADRNLMELYAEGGLLYTGLLPGRDQDTFGVAVAYGQISRSRRQLGRDQHFYQGGSDPLPDFEMVIETGYRAEIHPGWTVQPLLQYIMHPGGSSQIPDSLVLGLRSVIEF